MEAVQAAEEKKWDGFKELQSDMEKLFAERQFGEAAERSDVYLAQKGLGSEQKQAGLYLKYFAQMKARDFGKASETAQALQDEGPGTLLGKQAVALKQHADESLAKGEEPELEEVKRKVPPPAKEEKRDTKPKKKAANETAPKEKEKAKTTAEKSKVEAPEKPKRGRVVEMPKKDAKKGKGKNQKDQQEAQAKKAGEKEKGENTPNHEKTWQALDASHKDLAKAETAYAKAEKAFAKAKADLTAAQATHDEAHQAEVAARELGADKSGPKPGHKHEGVVKQVGSAPKKPAEEQAKATSQIEGFEKRSVDLRKQAAALRKKAAELRKAEEE